jgi:hypothetical protein
MSTDEITIRFPEMGTVSRSLPIVLDDGDHVLTLNLVGAAKLAEIIVHEASRRLGAAAALGKPSAYRLINDAAKDAVVVEFREGAAARSAVLAGDEVDVDGEPFLRLLYGVGEELEGIIIWNASRWLSPA